MSKQWQKAQGLQIMPGHTMMLTLKMLEVWHTKLTPNGATIHSHCLDNITFFLTNIKQLLDDVEHDIMNYQNRGRCYLPKPKTEADNTDTRF